MRCPPTGEAGYLLLAANFERFRQKSRSELSSQDQIGRVKAVQGLLPLIDAFEPLQASATEASEAEAKIHSFYSGVYKQFCTLLETWQVEAFEAVPGEKMDFSRHVALQRVTNDAPSGTILEAKKKGYAMAGSVVRSAECVASSGPEEAAPAPAEEAAEGEEEATESAEEPEGGAA